MSDAEVDVVSWCREMSARLERAEQTLYEFVLLMRRVTEDHERQLAQLRREVTYGP